MARMLSDTSSVRSAAHMNLLPMPGLPVQPVRRASLVAPVLGDITNTGFGASMKPVQEQKAPGFGVQKLAPAPQVTSCCGSTLGTGRTPFADVRALSSTGPGSAAIAFSREKPEVLMPLAGDCMDTSASAEDDGMQVEDPQFVAEYIGDIFSHLSSSEPRFQPRPDYIDSQREINSKMRGILVDWLVEVHMKYKLKPETLFLTVSLVDKYLDHRQVTRKRLQLCGVTAMLIAAKFEEIYPPEIKDFVYITDNAYSKEDILQMEVEMLQVLGFDLCGPTVVHFLERYQRANKCGEEHLHLMKYLAELCLLDVKMLCYTPSQIAAAALMLSNKLLKQSPAWPACMIRITRQSEPSVKACAKEMCGLLEAAERSPLQAVRRKYSQAKYSAIAKTTF
eukprot:TRINITY_DN38304_c0_g1_i1.p1 TRINITY_DN38304_c0_g1~~TRINITY_DN38304_c0_g1_i1.p1  ORF type:complete len:393 (+),score=79.86 TRINITY_DN38304_c0_g1_i1:72-1250(+)